MPQTPISPAPRNGWIVPTSATAALLLMGATGYELYLHAGALLQQGRTLPPALLLGLALVGEREIVAAPSVEDAQRAAAAGLHRRQGRAGVRRVEVAADPSRPVGHRADQGAAVRDRLVGRGPER